MIRSILAIWPPSTPSYWSIGHHFAALGEMANFLATRFKVPVDIIDAGVQTIPWAEIARSLLNEYDLVIAINQPENLLGLLRLLEFTKKMELPGKFITVGPLSTLIPGFFKQYPFDAIGRAGDWEVSVGGYLSFLTGESNIDDICGLSVRSSDNWVDTSQGKFCDGSEWGFPALDKLPLETYARLVGRRELSLTVARGCSMNCTFCQVPIIQGIRDRRRPITPTVAYLREHSCNFDYVSFYAPTFTSNRQWVIELCDEIRHLPSQIRWKCVTTVAHSDEDLIGLMASAGCSRIGFGIETLEEDVQRSIHKKVNEKRVQELIRCCRSHDILPLCFVMIGMPGQTKEGIHYTVDTLTKWGAQVRTTAYAPLVNLPDGIQASEVEAIDRLTQNWGNIRSMGGREIAALLFPRASNY